MCALLVGLPDVNRARCRRWVRSFGCTSKRPCERPRCGRCGTVARVKDRPVVELVDLPCFGRPARLVWHKRRWCCPDEECPVGSWTEDDARIARPRLVMTDRAGRWVTEQVGRRGRTVNEIAVELGC